MTVALVVRLHVEAQQASAVEEHLQSLATASRSEPGCLHYEVFRDRDEPGRFVVHERYVDDEAFEYHRATDHFRREFREAVTPHLIASEATTLEPVEEGLGTAAARPAGAALVLGAGSGICRAVALTLAEEGYPVVTADLEADAAEDTAREIRRSGGRARWVLADVTDRRSVDDAVDETVSRFDGLAILVNGAGHLEPVPLNGLDGPTSDEMIDVHLKGAMRATAAALTPMRAAGYGRIVHLSSVSALQAVPGYSHYAAAKAGILGFTRTIGAEVAPHGITVNCVLPGPIDTPMTAALGTEERERLADTPVGRIGSPDDVAYAVRYLTSPEASFVTGTSLIVAGGTFG